MTSRYVYTKMKTFVCSVCGKMYESTGSRSKYCQDCGVAHKREYDRLRKHKCTGGLPGRPKKIRWDEIDRQFEAGTLDEPVEDVIIIHAQPMGYAISDPGWR